MHDYFSEPPAQSRADLQFSHQPQAYKYSQRFSYFMRLLHPSQKATNPLTVSENWLLSFLYLALSASLSVPTIKTEPHDDFNAPLICAQQASGLSKPLYPQQVLTSTSSDPRSCVVGGAYPVSQQSLTAKSPSLPFSCSASTISKLFELSSSPFSKCLSASPSLQHPEVQVPIPHISIIQETSVRPHSSNLYPPNSSSSPPTLQPSPPNDTTFSQNHPMTPSQPNSGPQELPNEDALLEQKEGNPEGLAVSIKKEPQELDQIDLDDGEMIFHYTCCEFFIHSCKKKTE